MCVRSAAVLRCEGDEEVWVRGQCEDKQEVERVSAVQACEVGGKA